MKRHPKHARQLWGAPKRRRPIRWVVPHTTITVSIAYASGPASPVSGAALLRILTGPQATVEVNP